MILIVYVLKDVYGTKIDAFVFIYGMVFVIGFAQCL